MNMIRCFSSSVSKTALSKLRKKTGYAFANCRKALELHDNDVAEAEKWLHEQAQALGWSKATKLEGRPTVQGLIGVAVDQNKATMIELNCETDFVARNNKFKSMIETITATSLRVPVALKDNVSKLALNSEELKELKAEDGKPLADHLALLIGNVGENVTLRRGVCVHVNPGILISGFTHPAPPSAVSSFVGKYGALLMYKKLEAGRPSDEDIGKHLCQHIIGMNPQTIGEVGKDEPAENIDDETAMVNQEYLLDPSVTVGQILQDSGVQVLDFHRYECGEAVDSETEKAEKIEASA